MIFVHLRSYRIYFLSSEVHKASPSPVPHFRGQRDSGILPTRLIYVNNKLNMLSVFRGPSSTLCRAINRSAFALPKSGAKTSFALRNITSFHLSRTFSSKKERCAEPYCAAVLDEYDKPLVLASMTNNTPLGTDMVRVLSGIELILVRFHKTCIKECMFLDPSGCPLLQS